jgi:pyruvate dehydrogenase E2 component (dihydrolipoamide acetyltransferase)
MALEVVVPEVSDGVTTGTVIDLAVAVGDQVEADQTLLELETDKAVVAIPSPADGQVTEIKVAEGDSVEVGSVIMLLDAGGDDQEGEETPTQASTPESKSQKEVESKSGTEMEPDPGADAEPTAEVEEPDAEEHDAGEQQAATPSSAAAEQPAEQSSVDLSTVRRADQVAPAAPSVRRLARELGVDIYQVSGSGPGGRISETDVRQFVKKTMEQLPQGGTSAGEQPRGPSTQRTLPDFSQWGAISRESQSKIRQLTAEAMAYSWATIPMVTQYDKVRISELENFRKQFNEKATAENKLTVTAFLTKVCAAALRAFPHFNSSLDAAAAELIVKDFVNIGVAVDTPNGLLVPVLKAVDAKGVEQIAVELNELADRTRERRIKPEEMEGGTFTISNLGGIGGTHFTPLVYAPQVAILGVGKGQVEPLWNGREFVPETMVNLALTYDHRVIDGADGARFLRWICAAIENPLKLMM